MNSMANYLLCAYELKRASARGGENAPPWENKSMYTFYIDLFTGTCVPVDQLSVALLIGHTQTSGSSSPILDFS